MGVWVYADDLKIASTNQSALQRALDKISQWCIDWGMSLAVHKSAVIHFGSDASSVYLLHGIPIPVADGLSVRDLGICVDPQLKFSPHIHSLATKARRSLAVLFRTFHSRNPALLTRAYSIYILPLLESASVVWGSLGKKDATVLEMVQGCFTRRLFKRCCFKMKRPPQRRDALGLQSLAVRRAVADVAFARSVVTGKHFCPQLKLEATGPYPTRDDRRLCLDSTATKFRAKFATVRVPKRWNALPTKDRLLRPPAFRTAAFRAFKERSACVQLI